MSALSQSHKDIGQQLTGIIAQLKPIVAQLKLQADSTFEGKPWSEVGLAGFGDELIRHGKALAELGESINKGEPPKWVKQQQTAYDASAIGQLSRDRKEVPRAGKFPDEQPSAGASPLLAAFNQSREKAARR